MLEDVFERIKKGFQSRHARLTELLSRITHEVWPFAQSALLSPFFSAFRLGEDGVRFVALLWSLAGSSPSLARCFSSSWGQQVQAAAFDMMAMFRVARRVEENVLWELCATSRFSSNHRWTMTGMQASVLLTDAFAPLANALFSMQKVLKHRSFHGENVDWETLTAMPSKNADPSVYSFSEAHSSSEAGVHGEYAPLLLKRSMFMLEQGSLDKPFLRYLIRHVLTAGQTIGDFGANVGHDSMWLNETGLVESFAFDGIPGVERLSGGRVKEVQLAVPMDLGRSFDWIMCLEVGEHMPKGSEDTLLENIARHARLGAIISWATPDFPSPHHPNTLSVAESTRLVHRHGFTQDVPLTLGLRAAAEIEWLKQTAAVYRKDPKL